MSGRWVVCYEHRQSPLSDHLTATEAEECAQRCAHTRARTEGIARVFVVHDCYSLVHEIRPSA